MSLLSSSDATMTGYLTNAQTARDNSQRIPNNLLTNASATMQYTTPFNLDYPGSSTINSIIPNIIGSASNSNSISGKLYETSSLLYDTLEVIADNS